MQGKIPVDTWREIRRIGMRFGVEVEKIEKGKYRYILKNDTGSIGHSTFIGMSMYLTQRELGSISAKKMQEDLKSNARLDF